MAKYLKNRFPGRFNITYGNSTETLPEFRRQNPEVKCDLAITDGGHTVPVATADLENFYKMTNHRNLVLYDNHPDRLKIGTSWELMKRSGTLTEYFRCRYQTGNMHGFTFGQYIHYEYR